MLARGALIVSITVLGVGCVGIDRPADTANRQSLPDEPVNRDQLIYETVGNTMYFVHGPTQIKPPGMLPPGTRVQILENAPREPGYVPVRTEDGLEAYIPSVKLRSATGGVEVRNAKRPPSDEPEGDWFYDDGWF